MSTGQSAQSQVFADPTLRRLVFVGRFFAISCIAVLVWSTVFLGDIASPATLKLMDPIWTGAESQSANADLEIGQVSMPWLKESRDPVGPADAAATLLTCDQTVQAGDEMRLFAELPAFPDWAYNSLDSDCGQVRVLMPETFEIDATTMEFKRKVIPIEAQHAVTEILENAPNSLELFPKIMLRRDVNGKGPSTQLSNPEFRKGIVNEIGRAATGPGVRGMCLDAGAWPDSGIPVLMMLLAEMQAVLSAADRQTCLIVNARQALWKSRGVIDSVDRLVLRLYDEPWVGSPPAPLADADWFNRTAVEALRRIGHDKLIVAIGTASVDWVSGDPMPRTMSYSEAASRISDAGAQIRFSDRSLNAFSTFVDQGGNRHEIWMLDAATAHNQMMVLRDLGIANVALASLGYEDPAVWQVLGQQPRTKTALREILATTLITNYVHYSGAGPFLRPETPAVAGKRRIHFAEDSATITNQIYQKVPKAATVHRYGRAAANQIVLTFDDGPHPEYTNAILDTLKETGVPATFFVVGTNALRARDLVSRIADEGHEIGSHTFMHPRMDQVSYYRTVVEVNSVQKLVRGITGRAMRLYREPFLRSDGPVTTAQTEPLQLLNSAGYIVAGSDIVPPDWRDTTADDIVAHVVQKVEEGAGNIIVLHDAGGDRTQTVLAVPILIRALQERGYEFVTMADVLGTTRDALMPVMGDGQGKLDSVSFASMANLWEGLNGLFWLAIIIGVVRSAGVLGLALLRRPPTPAHPRARPSVTVVIPAYNEELVIVKSIRRVLASQYPGLKVIVVDDGSSDRTKQRVLSAYGQDPRVRLITQHNQGKWRALNAAYSIIDTEVAVCIDADTQVTHDAIGRLARHFADPEIGAVAGKLVVGNRRNLLTRLQALEYITAQAIDRRASDLINGMLVVPGAIGAWRVSAVRKVGLYSHATLSEDADLTISVNRAGYRATYDETALAYTEAPARLKGFMAQRLRWSLGMFQTGWKHRGAIREGRSVGLVALPDLAIFGYLFPLIAPFADLFFLYMVVDYVQAMWSTDARVTAQAPAYLFVGYLVLPLLEILIAFAALCIDRTERFWLLLLFPFQRLFYRQILYFTVFRALLRALNGRLSAWNKVDREGFVAKQGAF